jgi:hypothetical protein
MPCSSCPPRTSCCLAGHPEIPRRTNGHMYSSAHSPVHAGVRDGRHEARPDLRSPRSPSDSRDASFGANGIRRAGVRSGSCPAPARRPGTQDRHNLHRPAHVQAEASCGAGRTARLRLRQPRHVRRGAADAGLGRGHVHEPPRSDSLHEIHVNAAGHDFPLAARRTSVRPCRSGTSWGAARRATSATSGRSLASCASRRCAG